jgi:iron complex outermembrane recepter protein
MKTGNRRLALAISAGLSTSLGMSVSALAQVSAATSGTAQGPNESSTSGGNDLSEIIVTARRTEERAQDVPISMTVLTQEQLTNRNVTDAVDLANITTSLSVDNRFGNENASFAIRGFNQDSGTAPSVASYFADVVAPRGPTQGTQAGDSLGPGSFFDLQNIQVLKGPQGTLFGRNTTGGAILLVPQKPTTNFEGYLEGSYGNYDMWRLQGALNAPLSDFARFRIAFDHQEREGYLHNISGIGPEDYNDVNYTALRASLVLDLAANLENYTIASYSKSDTNGSVQKAIGCNPTGFNPPDPATGLGNFIGVFSCGQLAAERARGAGFYDIEAAVPDPVSRIEQWQFINTTTWTASDTLTLKNIASYAQYQDLQRSPLFGTNWQLNTLPVPYPQIYFRGIPAVFTGVFPIPGGDTANQSTSTEEFQVQGSAQDGRLIYQVGAYFEWSDPLSLVGNQSPQLAACTNVATLACSDPIGSALTAVISQQAGVLVPTTVGAVNYTAGETTYRDRGLYAQSSYSLTDRFKLTTGVRYTSDKQTNDSTRITYSFPVVPPYTGGATPTCTDPSTAPSCNQSLQEKSAKPTWLIDLDYKPMDDVLLYGKYARGYRAGGIFANAPIDHRVYDPEKLDNYELGLKTAYHGAVSGVFNVAAFYNELTDQQLQFGYVPRVNPITNLPAPVSPTGAIINAGKSRIYGAEIETSITPMQDLTFDLSYTYLRAEITQIGSFNTTDPNYQAAVSTYFPGTPFLLTPENKYSLSGNYTLLLDRNIGRIIFGANLVYTSAQLGSYGAQIPGALQAFGGDIWTIPSRYILNLNLNWNSVAGSPVDVSAFATNVTNKNYYQVVNSLASTGVETATLGAPRMYGVRVRYRFGGR